MRGDHPLPAGASEQARGPLRTLAVVGGYAGTTPACAGTTGRPTTAPGRSGDHPRMRGDHDLRGVHPSFGQGPPPHARGPRCRRHRQPDHAGTTPACAGTTEARTTRSGPPRDHPRMRGDHVAAPVLVLQSVGPPPHARGPHPWSGPGWAPAGTTPACAGTTHWGPGTRPWPGDHPRMRGDHSMRMFLHRRDEGPPPHARGPPSAARHESVNPGTTPACAGTTPRVRTWEVAGRDHPRMRGDHRGSGPHRIRRAGPPPHARGPRRVRVVEVGRPGTTPACAGTTVHHNDHANIKRDHPRMRGDHTAPDWSSRTRGGPPPHARGPQA